jgi:cardiolipin synthase A/B
MDDRQLQLLAALADDLPESDVNRLATAAAGGLHTLDVLRSDSASDRLRSACQCVTATIDAGANPLTVSGALLGAGAAARRQRTTTSVDVVWTGPTSDVTTGRLTAAVISEILHDAAHEILLIGYAVHNDAMVADGLAEAAQRNVAITLLLERSLDNPNYHASAYAFPGLRARRLAWPAAHRPANGAALHAKVLVVDRRIALVTTANITHWALERNLECGFLVHGGRQPKSIHDHIDSLTAAGVLVPVSA